MEEPFEKKLSKYVASHVYRQRISLIAYKYAVYSNALQIDFKRD